MMRRLIVAAVAIVGIAVLAGSAAAQDFYAGKQIRVIVGTGSGGGYDTWARLVARHLGEHIPGQPTIIVENMPGASGIKAVNYLYEAAPKDGTVLASFNNAIPSYQAVNQPGIRFKSEELSWIGSLSQVPTVIAITKRAGVKNIEQAKHKEVIIGATGTAGTKAAYPAILNSLVGTKFKIVGGHASSKPIMLAMERDEVQGDGGNPWSSWLIGKPDWVKDGTLVPLVQVGLKKEPGLPDVPLLTELARDDEQRAIFAFVCAPIAMQHPFAGPPGMPKERIEPLRRAFEAMIKDLAFLAEVERFKLDLTPLDGIELEKLVHSIVATPTDVVQRRRQPWCRKASAKQLAPTPQAAKSNLQETKRILIFAKRSARRYACLATNLNDHRDGHGILLAHTAGIH
jgi:tripartite-type tricarboxylate transporter receptor subunit TctC